MLPTLQLAVDECCISHCNQKKCLGCFRVGSKMCLAIFFSVAVALMNFRLDYLTAQF